MSRVGRLRAGLRAGAAGPLRETRGDLPWLALTALLAALLTVLVCAGPPVADRLGGTALHSRLETAQREGGPFLTHSTTLDAPQEEPQDGGSLRDDLREGASSVRALPPPVVDELLRPGPTRVEIPAPQTRLLLPAGEFRLSLLHADDAPSRPAYAAGRPPRGAPRGEPVEIAVSERTGKRLGLAVGGRTVVLFEDTGDPLDPPTVEVVVTGLLRVPGDPRAPLWREKPLLAGPASGGSEVQALVSAPGLEEVQRVTRVSLPVTWSVPLELDGEAAYRAADAAGGERLLRALAAYPETAQNELCPPDEVPCTIGPREADVVRTTDRAAEVVRDFARDWRQARTVMSLALGSLVTVLLATVVVTARLALRRRLPADTLRRARGAAPLRLAAANAARSAPAVLLGLAAGLGGAALLAPGRAVPLWPALAPAAASWLVLPVLTYAALREPHRARERQRAGDRGLRRLTLEAGVLLLAVAGLAGLRLRGTAEPADVWTASVPALLGLAAAIVLVRLYPPPLRALAALAARRRGTVALVALRRSAQEAPAAVLTLLVLLTTLAGTAFGGIVTGTLAAGSRDAAAWEAGADASYTGAPPGGPAAAALAALPAVDHAVTVRAVTVSLTDTGDGRHRAAAALVGVDPGALRRAAPGSAAARALDAAPEPSGAAALPALGPPELVGRPLVTDAGGRRLRVRVTAPLPDAALRDPALGPLLSSRTTDGPVLLLDADALAEAPAARTDVSSLLLYGPGLRGAELRTALATAGGGSGGGEAGAHLRVRSEEQARLDDDGVLRALDTVHLVCGGLAAVVALLALALELVLSAPQRARTAARLRLLGLGGRASGALTAVQLLPLTLAAAAGGTALGLALPALLGPALGLGVFTGGPGEPPVRVEPGFTVLPAGGLVLLVLAATLAEALYVRRRRLGAALRMGDAP